jgi:hypothetical protein
LVGGEFFAALIAAAWRRAKGEISGDLSFPEARVASQGVTLPQTTPPIPEL